MRACASLLSDAPELTLARLALVQAVAFVVASGLAVFGVEPVEEMRDVLSVEIETDEVERARDRAPRAAARPIAGRDRRCRAARRVRRRLWVGYQRR